MYHRTSSCTPRETIGTAHFPLSGQETWRDASLVVREGGRYVRMPDAWPSFRAIGRDERSTRSVQVISGGCTSNSGLATDLNWRPGAERITETLLQCGRLRIALRQSRSGRRTCIAWRTKTAAPSPEDRVPAIYHVQSPHLR